MVTSASRNQRTYFPTTLRFWPEIARWGAGAEFASGISVGGGVAIRYTPNYAIPTAGYVIPAGAVAAGGWAMAHAPRCAYGGGCTGRRNMNPLICTNSWAARRRGWAGG